MINISNEETELICIPHIDLAVYSCSSIKYRVHEPVIDWKRTSWVYYYFFLDASPQVLFLSLSSSSSLSIHPLPDDESSTGRTSTCSFLWRRSLSAFPDTYSWWKLCSFVKYQFYFLPLHKSKIQEPQPQNELLPVLLLSWMQSFSVLFLVEDATFWSRWSWWTL